MIPPPNNAAAWPTDYLDFLRGKGQDLILPCATIFFEPRDPSTALGRQGDENFLYSALIGTRPDNLQIILTYAPKSSYEACSWSYQITNGAEWQPILSFSSMTELIAYLEAEPVPPQQQSSKHPRRH